MIPRIALVAAVVAVAIFALYRPARSPFAQPVTAITAQPSVPAVRFERSGRRGADRAADDDAVVYVAGAVARPGLYHVHAGARNAQAVALAGGLIATADAAGINLAAHAQDGDEIYVPRAGETRRTSAAPHGARRHGFRTPPAGSVDVNAAAASELAQVPGIGRAVAARIVELRQLQGPYASLDELLDVAGMTQSRLERARAYLRQP